MHTATIRPAGTKEMAMVVNGRDVPGDSQYWLTAFRGYIAPGVEFSSIQLLRWVRERLLGCGVSREGAASDLRDRIVQQGRKSRQLVQIRRGHWRIVDSRLAGSATIDLSRLSGAAIVRLATVAVDLEITPDDAGTLLEAIGAEAAIRGWPEGWYEDPSVLSAEQARATGAAWEKP